MKSTQRQLKGSAYMYFCWLIEYKDIGFIGQFGAQSALNDAQINPNVLTFFTKMERGKGPMNRQVENYVFIHLIDYEPAVGVKFCRQVLEKCTRRRQRTVSMIFRLFGTQTSWIT